MDDNSIRKSPNCWQFPTLSRIRESLDQRAMSMRRPRPLGRPFDNEDEQRQNQSEQQQEEDAPVQRGLCCQLSECPNSNPPKSQILEETENLTIVNCPYLFSNKTDINFDPPQSSTRIERSDPPPISPMPSRQQPQQQIQQDKQPQPRPDNQPQPYKDKQVQPRLQKRQQMQPQLPPQTSTVASSPPPECQCDISAPERGNTTSNNDCINSLQEEIWEVIRNARKQPQPQYRPMEQQPPTLDSTYFRNEEDDYEEPCTCDQETPDDHQPLQFRTAEPTKDDCIFCRPMDVPQFKNDASMTGHRNNTRNPPHCPQQNQSMYASSHGAQATSQYQVRRTEPLQQYQSQRTATQTQGHMPQRPQCLNQNTSGIQNELRRQSIQTQTHYDMPDLPDLPDLPLATSMNRTQCPNETHASPCTNTGQFSNMGTANSTTYRTLPSRVSKQNVKFCDELAKTLSKEHMARMNEQTLNTNANLSRQQYPQQQYQNKQQSPPKCCQSKQTMSPCQNQLQEPPLYQSQQQYSGQSPCQQQQQQQQVYQQHDQFSYESQGSSEMSSCTCHQTSSGSGPNQGQGSRLVLGSGPRPGPGPSSSLDPCPNQSPGPSKPCCAKTDARSMPTGHPSLMNQSIPPQNKSTVETSKRNAYDSQFETLVLDTYYPGVIEDTVNNKINFNEYAYEIIFGGTIPAKPKADPMTLIEAFHLRLDWERNECSKNHSKSMCSPTDVEDHFRVKNKTGLNTAIASYMRAESVVGVSTRLPSTKLIANINRTETDFLGLPIKMTVYTGTTSPGF